MEPSVAPGSPCSLRLWAALVISRLPACSWPWSLLLRKRIRMILRRRSQATCEDNVQSVNTLRNAAGVDDLGAHPGNKAPTVIGQSAIIKLADALGQLGQLLSDDRMVDGLGRDYRLQDYGLQDYRLQDYMLQDYMLQDYMLQDYGLQDYRLQDYRLQNYMLQDYRLQDYRPQDHRLQDHRLQDYRLQDSRLQDYRTIDCRTTYQSQPDVGAVRLQSGSLAVHSQSLLVAARVVVQRP
ncbi:hypothetical protein CRUP_025319 [Coryphaenoides rupestris]|nr:hypothetical protein CRUP_025319 [Coryphaenoides rupestris]